MQTLMGPTSNPLNEIIYLYEGTFKEKKNIPPSVEQRRYALHILFTLIAIPPSIEHTTGTRLLITSKRRKEGEALGHSVQFHTNDV